MNKMKCFIAVGVIANLLCGCSEKDVKEVSAKPDEETAVLSSNEEKEQEISNGTEQIQDEEVTDLKTQNEDLTVEVSERNRRYREFLENDSFCIDGYFYGAIMFNVVDINNDGVPEMICNTNNNLTNATNVVEVWDGEYFLGGFESFAECRMTYVNEQGVFLVYENASVPGMYEGELVSVYAVNPEVEYGVEQVTCFQIQDNGEKEYFVDFEEVDEETYTKEILIYQNKEVELTTPYEITQENLDLLLPILE